MTSHDANGESSSFDSAVDRATRTANVDADPPLPDISPCYRAYLECHDHRPDSCTIYSAVTAETARGQWIRAWDDGFVSREDIR